MRLVSAVSCLVWKDLLLEARRRESLLSMFFFGALLLFLFHFSFELTPERAPEMAAGLLWLAFVFTGTVALAQLFQPERENRCLEALLMCPIDPSALYLAKVAFLFVLMSLIELTVFPLFAILFNLDYWRQLPALFGIALLGTLGFCALGTLFAAVTIAARARELLLPLVLFPLLIPVILGTVRAMESVLRGGALDEMLPWLRLLGAFDVIFLTAGYLTFAWVVES